MISESEGTELVRLARKAVETYLQKSVVINPEQESVIAGVFVTLNYQTRNKEEHLRGCIGFPMPEKKLHQSVIEAAIAAATQDPRFPPVDRQELDSIIFEVSVLTTPEEVMTKPTDYEKEIKIGRDGLVLRWRYGSGLLLPQVPVELNWDIDEYLANICYKAGAPADAWLDPESKLYKFQASVFKECEPNGRVTKLEL
ncbi:MAG TPA: TIGR00296 family protein [Nitrososphaera sp.]|nr:TIGR00296 family protein [Nitrososphaera sp.]